MYEIAVIVFILVVLFVVLNSRMSKYNVTVHTNKTYVAFVSRKPDGSFVAQVNSMTFSNDTAARALHAAGEYIDYLEKSNDLDT